MTPARAVVLPDPLGRFGEGGQGLGAAPLDQWVAALAGDLAVGECLLARLLERNEREAPESQLAPAPPDYEPLYPPPRAGGLHEEVQAVAVRATDERSPRESVLMQRRP